MNFSSIYFGIYPVALTCRAGTHSLNKRQVMVTINGITGSLDQLKDIKRSFDYSAYTFGDQRLQAAVWDTGYRADDGKHKQYPEWIQIGSLWGRWKHLEEIINYGEDMLKHLHKEEA